MSTFGSSLGKRGATEASNEPAPKLRKRGPIPLMELDLSKLEFGTKVEAGAQGDRFVRLTYDGGRLEIAVTTLPNWSRAPFAAGPPKTADGSALGTAWGMAVALSVEEYEKFAAFEAYVVKKLQPLKNELFPADAKKKGKAGLDDNFFQLKYNSKLTAPNPDKGYPPHLRVFVETDPTRFMPKIQKMHLLEGNKCTRPIKGDVNDLVAKSAVSMVISLVRGFYAGQTGSGCKFSATSIDILTNLQETNAPEIDYSKVEFIDQDTPVDAPAAAASGEADDKAASSPVPSHSDEPVQFGGMGDGY